MFGFPNSFYSAYFVDESGKFKGPFIAVSDRLFRPNYEFKFNGFRSPSLPNKSDDKIARSNTLHDAIETLLDVEQQLRQYGWRIHSRDKKHDVLVVAKKYEIEIAAHLISPSRPWSSPELRNSLLVIPGGKNDGLG